MAVQPAWTSPPPYSVNAVDYLDNERLTSAAIYPAEFGPVESASGAPGVCWTRSQSTRVRLTLGYPGPTEHDATLTVYPGDYVSASGTHPVAATPGSFQVHFTPGGEAAVEFDLVGMPDFVTLGDLEVEVSCVGVTSLAGQLDQKVWLTDAAPLGGQPGHQVPVWSDVLDLSCTWASGLTGSVPCRSALTLGIFDSGRVYEPAQPQYFRLDDFIFELKGYLSGTPTNTVDCHDVTCFLTISAASIGIATTPEKRFFSSGSFRTNPACPIGVSRFDPANYNWVYIFANHTQCSGGGYIYDACIAQKWSPSGALWLQPPQDWGPVSYWQFYAFGNWGGLVANYAYAPGNAFVPLPIVITLPILGIE